ncbi:MAG: glucose-6-phosphate dehydrogenase [Planctomycetota bacterium]|jgi:glucose-6-phosphate 1-dehydrogenase
MPEIKPLQVSSDIVCAETPAPPSALVVFGASGDLVHRKLIPSIFHLFQRDLLHENFYLLGAGRTEFSDEQFRQTAQQAIMDEGEEVDAEQVTSFFNNFYYIHGDYNDPSFYKNIKARLVELDSQYKSEPCHIFYLAVPPVLYNQIIDSLGQASLSCVNESNSNRKPRLVVEKPFGSDLQTSLELNKRIHRCFDESQIYRIDHYLGKETVQNILMFRFANAIFEPVWNRNFIDNIQITASESVGVEHRAGYYDKSGAMRDMFQNHMLGMLALVAMEPPTSFDADHIRDEKVKLLRSIQSFDLNKLDEYIVRGQYGPGIINEERVSGYVDEEGVDPQSKTETYVAAKVFVGNWRWKGIPFYLRTGKRLAAKNTEITITFKKVPHSMFTSFSIDDLPANILTMKIQPEEGISLSFQAKRPGSKACIGTLNMSFNYHEVFGAKAPEAYQRLLLDCMLGDQSLFTREDDVEVSWALLTPILQSWQEDSKGSVLYSAGCESFLQADAIIESDGRKWHKMTSL